MPDMELVYSPQLVLFILNILHTGIDTQASSDVQAKYPFVTINSCPKVTQDTGDTIKYTPKILLSELDWILDELPSNIVKHYYCAKPACLSDPCLHGGTCVESETGFRCSCLRSYYGDRCENVYHDCLEIQVGGELTSGVYVIRPDGDGGPFQVYCDMETDGGGWTVFQRRQDGSIDFYLYWSDYKHGFGNVSGEHWLGNDYIHRLTSQKSYELRVDLEDFEGESKYALYSLFTVANESFAYAMTAGGYSGTAGDSLTRVDLTGDQTTTLRFTTRDADHDTKSNSNCAIQYTGAWWYSACHEANLNGLYLSGPTNLEAQGVSWYNFRGHSYSLKKTEMKLRPIY